PSRLNAFGRIDVVPEGRRRWTALERWVRRCGGRTDVLGERDAVVELGPTRFACIASVRRGPGLRLVLVSGIAVRPALSPALSAYLSGVLRAVRRHTRIGN
ncbi:MAG TPA: hypothetical protein VEJ18_06560, partial [Planctomycetota bacterium]|nr:hypothetical protein [Planctomycetota bacterium]